MHLDELVARLRRPQAPAPIPSRGRPSAVLVPVYERDGGIHLLFTKRSQTVAHHKGQISFPGGMQEPNDADLRATALRESREEIGIPPERVSVVADLPPIVTITNFMVMPYVGVIPADLPLRPETGEISEILRVPLDHLSDPRNQRTLRVPWIGRMETIYYFDYPPHVIWGATGRILRDLLDRLRGDQQP